MTQQSGRVDAIVVGAGAAGIAAARELAAHGHAVTVIEARDRLGGRAHTADCGTSHALDLGCEWLHSADRNVLAGLARARGVRLDTRDPPWRRRHVQPGFGEAEQDAFGEEQAAFWARLEEAGAIARRTGRDRPAAELLDPAARFNGFTDAISTYYNGAPLARVSVLDFYRYVDTELDWRIPGGYGAFIASLGADLPTIHRDRRVTAIDTSGTAIRVDTDGGPLVADRVIVTVPSSVLAAGAIRFTPALDDHLHAAAGLPLGVADKVFLRIADPDLFAPESRLIGSPLVRDTGSYTMRAYGRDLVEGYFGGDYARHLEAGGLAAFADAARREIGALCGHDVAKKLVPVAATAWATDPLSLGSYSHALPGHADDRATLAQPIDGRLAFAGEATSPQFFSTAHGAWESGVRAAREMVGAAVHPAGLVA